MIKYWKVWRPLVLGNPNDESFEYIYSQKLNSPNIINAIWSIYTTRFEWLILIFNSRGIIPCNFSKFWKSILLKPAVSLFELMVTRVLVPPENLNIEFARGRLGWHYNKRRMHCAYLYTPASQCFTIETIRERTLKQVTHFRYIFLRCTADRIPLLLRACGRENVFRWVRNTWAIHCLQNVCGPVCH